MLKEEKKAIDELEGLLMAFGYQGNIDNQKEWNYLRDEEPDNYKTAKAIETVLNLIQSQQKEIETLKQAGEATETVYKMQLEKKDKIIDMMARELFYNSYDDLRSVEEIKQYFEKKVEEKN